MAMPARAGQIDFQKTRTTAMANEATTLSRKALPSLSMSAAGPFWSSYRCTAPFTATPAAPTILSTVADGSLVDGSSVAVSYTHLRAHETVLDLVCRLL